MKEKKTKIEAEVLIEDIYSYPNFFSNGEKTNVVFMLDDKGTEFTWSTTSKNFPEMGSKALMTAFIKEVDIERRDPERVAYRVSNCRFKKLEK